MDQTKITPVILCGGSGRRLWPRSRSDCPKPFLPLIEEKTLFQEALDRVAAFESPVIVTGPALVDLVGDQLNSDSQAKIVVEPEGKNTAAAIGLAACLLGPEDVMLVCPSDHHIGDEGAFLTAARDAATIARQGRLVCLAAEARSPETGFGYIRRGSPIGGTNGFEITEFVEKPGQSTADSYVKSGNYAWNAGIFVFRAGDFLSELARHRESLAAAVRTAVTGGKTAGNRFEPDAEAFSVIAAESVDHAVFENTDRAAVVVTDMDWSDIGTWSAVHAARPSDSCGNTVRGPAELVDCHNVLIDTDDQRIVAIGLDGIFVVASGGNVIIAPFARAGEVADFAQRGNRETKAKPG